MTGAGLSSAWSGAARSPEVRPLRPMVLPPPRLLLLLALMLALLTPRAAAAQDQHEMGFDAELFEAIYQGKVAEVVRRARPAPHSVSQLSLTREVLAGFQGQEW